MKKKNRVISKSRYRNLFVLPVLLALLFPGCIIPKHDQTYISKRIEERTQFKADRNAKAGELSIPANVKLDDGITEDEAVAIALYNNPQFQADLINISIANADLIDAGQLPNPLLSVIFPTGADPLKGALNFALEALWQRPFRMRVARLESQRTAERLVNTGLQLIKDVKIAYAEHLLAQDKMLIGKESLRIRTEMAGITVKRFKAGDISEMEASIAVADSLRAKTDEQRTIMDAGFFHMRLLLLMGLDSAGGIKILPQDTIPRMTLSLEELLRTAYATRTDLKAATLAIEAKGKQAGWERSKIFSFIGILNARKEEDGLALGPGVQVAVPVFSWNRGKILRAKAEMEQAAWQYVAVRQNISLEVKQAHAEYEAAITNYERWQANGRSLERVSEQAKRSFDAGEISYYFYLETIQQALDIKLREAESKSAVNIAIAKLNYAVGKKQL